MARPRRRLLRLVAGAAAAGAALLVVVSWTDRRAALATLPAGAAAALEVVDAAGTLERIEGTRFAAAFAASTTKAWLEQSPAARALDDIRADIGRATGYTPARRRLLDLVGAETAVAWYPPREGGPAAGAPWVAAGRLSWPAWGVAGALRGASRLGLGSGSVTREEVAGTTVLALGSGPQALHLFFLGRLAVTGSDRESVHRAARVAAGVEPALPSDAAWTRAFGRLPARGELKLYARTGAEPPFLSAPGSPGTRAVAAVVSTGRPVVADVFVDSPVAGPAAAGDAAPPPVLGLAGDRPLFFFSSAGPVPPPLADWLADRARQVSRLQGTPARPLPPFGRGFALAVTSAADGALFPRPEGLVAVGMRDAAAAGDALRSLFPAGARAAGSRWGTALATRESFPLAGEFQLWGAAAGSRLVFATNAGLLDALERVERTGGPDDSFVPGAGWPVDTVGSVNVARALPVLRRYAGPLSGLLLARHPGAPDASRDLALLEALRTVGVAAGTGPEGTLARVTAEVGDIPAAPAAGLPAAR